jgi:AraC-like DNA-binding protein
LHAAPAGIRHDGNQFGIQLELTPAGSRVLFGMPAAELARTVCPFDAVAGPAAGSLPDRLRSQGSWTDRFRVLDQVLTGWLRDPTGPRDEVARAWAVLACADGLVDVGSIAAEVGWSRRHLGQQFRQEFGLPPKVVARVMRFERAKALMTAGSAPDLAAVAATAGYSDQPHLTREWRDLAGSTPAGWLRGEEFPFVQDGTGVRARS